ncbi:MAG: hypothetical protein NTZ78_04440 [Candidatus Aureabacteria bacterium]|nr:hypothetical protein [Candidatus Auribacterota bacterium]
MEAEWKCSDCGEMKPADIEQRINCREDRYGSNTRKSHSRGAPSGQGLSLRKFKHAVNASGIAVWCAVALLSGCATIQTQYEQAITDDSMKSYYDFLSRHPQGAFSSDIQMRLRGIEEKRIAAIESSLGIRMRETEIPLPDSSFHNMQEIVYTANRAHEAVLLRRSEKGRGVLLDGKIHPSSDLMLKFSNTLTLSPNGEHIAFITHKLTGPSYLVMDKNRQVLSEILVEMALSDNGKVAYIYATNPGFFVETRWGLVVGNQRSPLSVGQMEKLRLSPDGEHVACILKELRSKWTGSMNYFVMLDGKRSQAWDSVDIIFFSDDSGRLIYTATSAEGKFIVSHDLVKGSQQLQPYDSNIILMAASSDGGRIAFAQSNGRNMEIMLDNLPIPISAQDAQQVSVDEMIFSPDGKQFAYIISQFYLKGYGTKVSLRRCAVVNGKASPWYEDVGWIRFSMDSQHYAYPVCEGGVPEIATLSEYGQLVAYVYIDRHGGRWSVAYDGEPGLIYDWILHGPRFTGLSASLEFDAIKLGKRVSVQYETVIPSIRSGP